MDLPTVNRWITGRSRADLVDVGPSTGVVADGTWLFSAPDPLLDTLVDLTTMGWEPLVVHDDELEIAATCTVARLRRLPGLDGVAEWSAAALLEPCCAAFASAPKIWEDATVGGNVCVALPAGPMISLLCAVDATALIWSADGASRSVPVEDFVLGPRHTALGPGEVLRSLHVPWHTLTARYAFRRIALHPEGRSGAIVIARQESDGAAVVTVTAATARPRRVAFSRLPSDLALAEALGQIPDWYDDQHGTPSWRRHMTRRLALEAVEELRHQ